MNTGPTPVDEHRLVPSPVFIYNSERSGSTLLRMILDGHSEICAPRELHLETVRAEFTSWYGEDAWADLGVGTDELVSLLRDRLLHLRLVDSGKSVVVDKTPANVLIWPEIRAAWPQARYVFLKRHPVRIAESLAAASPEFGLPTHYERLNAYLTAWVAAREALPGPTVSYEQLTDDPERVVRTVCDHLGVAFEPAMLDYASRDRSADYRRGLGDWSDKIRSGTIHQAAPLPDRTDVPDELVQACWRLGYL